MNTDEVTNLIKIQDYIDKALNMGSTTSSQAKELSDLQLLINRKIFEALTSDDFKDCIEYYKLSEVKKAAVEYSNIKTRFK